MRLEIPYVCSTTTFAFNQYTATLVRPKAGELVRMILGAPRINRKMALLRQHGYPVKNLQDLLGNSNSTSTVVYTSSAFQPMAETFSDRFAFVGPSVSLVQPAAGKARPVIYISLGTVMNRRPNFYRRCFQALGDLDADVILSVGEGIQQAALGPTPSNFQVSKRVNQMAVLAGADVFLTHCGMNSANEAILCGVPTVLFPQQSEEVAVADRMEALELGVRLKRDSPEGIRKAVETLLTRGNYRANNLRMAETFRAAGGPERAAAYILACCR